MPHIHDYIKGLPETEPHADVASDVSVTPVGAIAATNVQTAIAELDGDVQSRNPYHGVLARPVGATNPLPTYITTTTFTLGATANPITYYYQGTKVIVSSDKTATLADGAGLYFIFFDGTTGNILASKNFPGINESSNIIIATCVWNGTALGLVGDERHSYSRNKRWHEWAHNTVGVRYRSGITLTHNSGTGAAATFATTAGELADEDIQFSVPASSAFPTANAGRLFYQTGAAAYAFVTTPATTPGYLGANNRPNYVNTTGYALTEMTSAVNRYINVFVYGTQDLHTPIYFFTETVSAATAAANGYTSVANARAVPFPNLSGFGLSPELKPLYRLIWRADGALQAISLTQDDYRTVSSLPMAAGNTATTASSVSFNPSGTIEATTVQTAIEELDATVVSASVRVVALKILDDATALTIGDGKMIFMIPTELNGMNLVSVAAFCSTVSSSGLPTFQIRNVTDSVDMLSTKVSIDASEYTSYTATTAAVIDTSYDNVATGDLIAIDCDVAGTGCKGAGICLGFALP